MSNKQTTRHLVPRLRFPEFRDAGEWNDRLMGEVYSFKGNNSLSREKLNYRSGSVKNIHYGDIHTKFLTLFDITKEIVPYINEFDLKNSFRLEDYCVEGDIIFADASEDLSDIGKSIEIINLNGERVVSGLHTILARQTADWLVVGFGGYLFKSQAIRKQIQKESQGTKVLGISGVRLAKVTIFFPSDKNEQQRIADCLTSLDDLIALEAQKLDALKAHKRGLMQQLFPAEGETLPRLRFPEFQDAGEWEVKPISELFDLEQRLEKAIVFENEKVITVKLHTLGVVKNERASTLTGGANYFKRRAGEFIFSKIDLLNGAFGLVPDELDGFLSSSDVPAFTFKDEYVSLFFLNWLKANYLNLIIERTGTSSTLKRVSPRGFLNLPIPLPSRAEQQRIADCLTSLDDLIALEAQKLDALKTHKRGLMQQLFPTQDPDDA